jgi:hypothetical protein
MTVSDLRALLLDTVRDVMEQQPTGKTDELLTTEELAKENALPDILMTMSQIPLPDVNRELAEVGAMFSVFDALRRKRGR